MVHGIVRQCGGHIIVDSEPGRARRFLVYFPRQARCAAAPVRRRWRRGTVGDRCRARAWSCWPKTIASVRRLVVTELTRRGFTVIEAEDGRAALEIFRSEKDRVDVLVTDVVMPRMNGADLAKAAERIRPGLKILFISGHPERAGAGLDPTGVTNLLMKPFTADTLAARIKDLIDRKARRPMAGAPEAPVAPPRAGQVGPDRDRRQPGDRQRDLPAAVATSPRGSARGDRSRSWPSACCRCRSRCASRKPAAASIAPAARILPARAAFGRFVGFEVGWMMWFARVASHASVVNGLTLALAFYWPSLADRACRGRRRSPR